MQYDLKHHHQQVKQSFYTILILAQHLASASVDINESVSVLSAVVITQPSLDVKPPLNTAVAVVVNTPVTKAVVAILNCTINVYNIKLAVPSTSKSVVTVKAPVNVAPAEVVSNFLTPL